MGGPLQAQCDLKVDQKPIWHESREPPPQGGQNSLRKGVMAAGSAGTMVSMIERKLRVKCRGSARVLHLV